MRRMEWVGRLGAAAVIVTLGGVQAATAEIASDRAAAILNYPYIVVDGESVDTVITISNASTDPVNLWCFYQNANSHCTNTGEVCTTPADCCVGGACGVCEPGWNETDFNIRLTPLQPLGWAASEGRSEFPIDGVDFVGIGGSSNAGSRIPPVPEDPFVGVLECIATDDQGNPVDRNVLKGQAANETLVGANLDVAKYNAIGFRAEEGAVNDDNELVLGGEAAEYTGCPNVLIVNHFFDGVTDPATGNTVETTLVLTPCTVDFLRQIPGSAVVQYLVYNEFEQRFSTSRTVRCQQAIPLSLIDTTQPERSIFSAGVSGTVVGQTRLTPIGDGLIGVAIEDHESATAAFNIHYQGDRAEADTITLP